MKKKTYIIPTIAVVFSLPADSLLEGSQNDHADAKPHATHNKGFANGGNNAPWSQRYSPWENE